MFIRILYLLSGVLVFRGIEFGFDQNHIHQHNAVQCLVGEYVYKWVCVFVLSFSLAIRLEDKLY